MNHLLANTLNLHYTKQLVSVCILLILATTVLSACTEAPSNINNTYIERLENITDKKSEDLPVLKSMKLNPLSELKNNKITLGIVELAGISSCNLNVVISEHNNQLGKTATAAGRLKYQIDFIQHANSCLASLEKSSATYKKIREAKNQKQANLLHYFNAALIEEPELNRIWSLTASELSKEPAGFSDTIEAMQKLTAIKAQLAQSQFDEINADAIYQALETLNKYRFNQSLIKSVRQQIRLNQSATNLVENIDLNTLCPKNKNKNKAKIMNNIFQKYYLSQIQPYQAQLIGFLEVLQPLLNQVWYKEPVTTDAINELLAPHSKTNLLNQLKSSAKQHVIWWQEFYKTCEISPI
ncbi:DUF3080 family protein [Pseudoalteromonas sp. 10-33]|uniref:DUF3080 family protein n=1 Tax=Pseudoalteromonas sp. 10-33 TaxID=1761890 RepID=UPI0007323FEA|nr:DUF3080 family protein [Pseudoalteromonas sp. 10-33]KTF08869.1 hypothetical protein ATS76_12215 [Pseudoalteromonas sp. 10-33]